MTLSDLSIKNPVFAWMLMFGLIIFGFIGLGRLGVSQMPDYDFPVLTVTVKWPGTAPELMETSVVDSLEEAIISVEKITGITSQINSGIATITVNFEMGRDIDAALQEIQSKISGVKLPTDVQAPTIEKNNPDDQPIIWVGISGKRSLHDLIVYTQDTIKDQFQLIPGVGEMVLGGFAERNLRVWVDQRKLAEYDLTILDVKAALTRQHYESSSGILENKTQKINVRTLGEAVTPEQVAAIPISQRGGKYIYDRVIKIGDIARVEDGLNDLVRINRINGIPGVGLGIKKQHGENAIEVGKRVKKKIAEIKKTLPADMEIGINFDTTKFTEESISETEFTLILSALICAFVCFLFLGSWSSSVNILLSIPTSILGTFLVIYFAGFTLNLFTLLALTLAVGIVVDDAIMVLENIVRHRDMGKDRMTAARDGAREITFAAITATIAVISIFLPVAFMTGIIGKFFYQFGITLSAAVALSLLEAITLTPMRSSQFLSARSSSKMAIVAENTFAKLAEVYRFFLIRAMKHRYWVLGFSILFFVGTMFIIKLLRSEFIPPQDQGVFLIRYQTPVGSSLEFTSEKLKLLEDYLGKRPDCPRYFAIVGGQGGGQVNTGIVFVTLSPQGKRKSQAKIMDEIRADMGKTKGLKVFIQDLSMRGFAAGRTYPVDFNIRGKEWDVLRDKSAEVVKKLAESGLAVDVDSDYRVGQPEVRLVPDRDKVAESGIQMKDLGDSIETAIGGSIVGKFSSGGRRFDMRLKVEPVDTQNPVDIQKVQVRTPFDVLIPISKLMKQEKVSTLQTIVRRDRERSVSVYGNVAAGKSQGDAIAMAQKIGKEVLPEGYRLVLSEGSQAFAQSFGSLGFALLMGLLVSYMVLASQFNSFSQPILILLALPFSLSGAFIALYVSNNSISLYSMIGIILLMGIVKKNSILLVEFTNHKRQEGLPVNEAIMVASPIRLRPILMTSVATIAAALPPALAFGPGAESRVPMALTIIGGVLISTFFTLFVVPCAYSLMPGKVRPLEEKHV